MSRPTNSNLAVVILGSLLSLVLLALSFVLFWPESEGNGPVQAVAESASAPRLTFPAGCAVGRDCWYFAYVDLDSGPGYRDYRCGVRSYERHKGTDVAPGDPQARVAVLAAAGGTVVGRRDGMDDRPTTDRTESVEGSECGNGVRIDHGDGWVTQYCHLARGSVRVQKGEAVAAGQELGEIGASGLAELPHLHFQLEHEGAIVDPFTGRRPDAQICKDGRGAVASLWRGDVQAYVPTVVYRAGLLTEVPDRDRAARGDYPSVASTDGAALIAYAVVLGAPAGAKIVTEILGPDGQALHRQQSDVERDFARFFSYSGRKRPEEGWKPGTYTALVTVMGEGPDGRFSATGTAKLELH